MVNGRGGGGCWGGYLRGELRAPQHEAQRAAAQHGRHRQGQEAVPLGEVPQRQPRVAADGGAQTGLEALCRPSSSSSSSIIISGRGEGTFRASVLLAASGQQELVHDGRGENGGGFGFSCGSGEIKAPQT